MNGLECSEISKNELERTFRVDSEFYRKENLIIEQKIQKSECVSLTELVDVSDGNHMSISDKFVLEGIPYYRGQDVQTFFIEDSSPICIDETSFNSPYIKRSHLQKGDVLLSIVGTIGKLSLVNSEKKATCSCKLAILRPKKGIQGEILATFLSSKYGQNQIKKYTRGAVQMGLILEDMNQLIVPKFGKLFAKKVKAIFEEMNQKRISSKQAYERANTLLLHAIPYENISDQKKVQYTSKALSNSFFVSGRLDAEYYQPKYDKLFEVLDDFDTFPLGGKNGLVNIQKSIEPGRDFYQKEGIPFVRVSDVDKFEISMPNIKLPKDIVTNIESLFLKKDTILLSKDGSIGIAYKIQENADVITSGALLHLTVKDTNIILPDYLTLVLNSPIVQLQAERDSNGAIIQHWKPSDIEKVIIPVLDINKQKEISEKVQESFRLRGESKQLLGFAIRAVEMAIELDEKAALSWLEMQM